MKRKAARPLTSNKIKRSPGGRTRFAGLSDSPLSRLARTLDIFQFTAADEIMAAYKMAACLPVSRDPDLGLPPSAARAGAADEHAACRSDLTDVQRTWRNDLRNSVVLRVAEAVLFHETPLSALDAANRWRKGTAREHLATALKHFAALRGNCPRGAAREWKFNATQPRKETT